MTDPHRDHMPALSLSLSHIVIVHAHTALYIRLGNVMKQFLIIVIIAAV